MHRASVVHIAESFGGGVAAAIGTYVKQTPELEHHVIVHERADAPLAGEEWKRPFASVTYLPDSHVKSVSATARVLRRVQPDIVHSHSSYGGLYGRLAAWAVPSARQVYTPHGWAFTRLDKSVVARAVFWLAEAILSLKTDVLAACSPNEGRVAPRIPVRRRGKVVVVPNIAPAPNPGMVDAVVGELPSEPEGDGPLLVGAGRFHLAKGPEFFVDAVQSIRSAGNPVRVQWIGGGDPEWEERMRRADIDITGWTTPEQASALLGRADFYLHSALWDGFPLTVLQAHDREVPTLLRDIKSFRGLDWPFKLNSPDDLLTLWPELVSETGRKTLLAGAETALAHNNPGTQRQRLLEAYGLTSPGDDGGRS